MGDPFPTRYPDPADSPGYLLWQVAMRWQRRQRAALEPVGLTHAQFALLAGIAWRGRSGDPPTQVELAQQMSVDVMMTSEVVRALERKGLVRRARHPTDARAWTLALTPLGAESIGRALPLVEAADAEFFATAGLDAAGAARLLRPLLARAPEPADPPAVDAASPT